MRQLIHDLIFALRFKRAVKKANRLAALYGIKYFVIVLNGGIKVVPKRTIRLLLRTHRFRKGTRMEDIERRALFITK